MRRLCFFALIVCLFASPISSEFVPFNTYEDGHVHLINSQLPAPLTFEKYGFWNNRVDKYLFYAMGLEVMKGPLKR